MAINVTYTGGVIAVREKSLLKDKLLRMAELTAEEAFRMLLESGYGGGELVANVYVYEKLVKREESLVDDFIREYAPSKTERAYFLAPRDFHNLKALLKADYLGEDAEKLLAPEGEIPVKVLQNAVKEKDFAPLAEYNPVLKETAEAALALFDGENPSGAVIGAVFEKANAEYLFAVTKKNPTLRKLFVQKIDMTNILTTFRASDFEIAESKYLPRGSVSKEKLERLLSENREIAVKALKGTPYDSFVSLCFQAKDKGLPMTTAEKAIESLETEYFHEKRFDLKNKDPFLYYILRRKTENANVRIVFVCKLAGLSEQDVKRRLRAL